MKQANRVRFVVCAIGVLALSINAKADFIMGYGWVTTDGIVSSGTGATAASLALNTCHDGAGACTTGNADVTFTTTGIDFSGSGLTIAQWLASSVFALHNLVDNQPNHFMVASIWEFGGNTRVTGTPDSPQNFTITHDDSTTFAVNGQPPPGPTRVGELQRFFHFYLYECCGGQAGLETSLIGPQTAPTPEPREVAFLLVGLLTVAGLIRRKLASGNLSI